MTRKNGETVDDMIRKELVMEALAELAPEIEAAYFAEKASLPTRTRPSTPRLGAVLGGYLPLPREALFLGVAVDRLPVLLNLSDPVPGPILIGGDGGSGKTHFLRVIAHGVDQTHDPRSVQYGVVTARPDEWQDLAGSPNCVDVFPSYRNDADGFVASLTDWAHANRRDRQAVLLLIDDLTVFADMDFETRQNLRWLLLRGPSRRVWPIATLDPRKLEAALPWLDLFHTRLFGAAAHSPEMARICGGGLDQLDALTPGSDFMMREGGSWLKFWLPSIEEE